MNKIKIISYTVIILSSVSLLSYLIGWQYPVSSGYRSGKLVKISKKGRIIKTCEGTLDLGSGDNLTWDFSVKDSSVCDKLKTLSSDFVDLEYKETFFGFPRDTHYQVRKATSSKTKINNSNLVDNIKNDNLNIDTKKIQIENKEAFCSLLGSIYEYKEVYIKVEAILKTKNPYLYKKIETCNNP